MRVTQPQVDAMGPGACAECGMAAPPVAPTDPSAGDSVVVVGTGPAWLGIQLENDRSQPVANEPFVLHGPGGQQLSGRLDRRGRVRIEGLEPATYRVTFPDRDAREWAPER